MASPVLIVTGPSGAGKTTVSQLVAATFELSAHIRADEFMAFVVSGWTEPWMPEAAHQNYVLGGAAATAAVQFALGGYTVLLDGTFFPAGVDGMAQLLRARGIELHCAVLRPDLETCAMRVARRDASELRSEPGRIADLHARYADLGAYEEHVIDASTAPDSVAAGVLAAFNERQLLVA